VIDNIKERLFVKKPMRLMLLGLFWTIFGGCQNILALDLFSDSALGTRIGFTFGRLLVSSLLGIKAP